MPLQVRVFVFTRSELKGGVSLRSGRGWRGEGKEEEGEGTCSCSHRTCCSLNLLAASVSVDGLAEMHGKAPHPAASMSSSYAPPPTLVPPPPML